MNIYIYMHTLSLSLSLYIYIYIYSEMITIIKLINTSITSHSYLCVYVCVCMMRKLKIYSLSKFHIYSTVLLFVVIMMYIRS